MWFWSKKDKRQENKRDKLRAAPREFSEFQVFLESHLDNDAYRGQIEDTLVLQLDSPIQEPVKVRLDDLCIQGASVLVPVPSMPVLSEGEIVGVRIEHAREGWAVLTPGLVRSITEETRRYFRIGLEFINPGNLYSQLEDGLGSYFNRRTAIRLKNEPLMFVAQIRGSKATRLRARVIDISVTGLGAWVSHVEGASLKQGDEVMLTLTLPDKLPPIEGAVRVMRKENHGPSDIIGLQFLLDKWKLSEARRLEAVVQEYLSKRLRWSA